MTDSIQEEKMSTDSPTTVHEAVDALNLEKPDPYSLAIFGALQTKPFYYGTVEPAVKAKRRAKNKVARAQRRVNRRSA